MATVKFVSGKQSVAYRNYRRARDRALSRLAQAYPDDYKELLEQEKASDEQEGKKWIPSDTAISITRLDIQPGSTDTPAYQTDNEGENAGDNGGEA